MKHHGEQMANDDDVKPEAFGAQAAGAPNHPIKTA